MRVRFASKASWLAIQLVITMAILPVEDVHATSTEKIRKAAVAGKFYPSDRKILTATIDSLLARVPARNVEGEILAALAPHAGYPYSGPVAAYTYAALKGRKYARVVVIAPSHYDGFDFTSVYNGDAYETPLGRVSVDKEFARQLVKSNPTIRLSDRGHDSAAAAEEHSVEVQLPWLQRALGEFELVPIVMGSQSYEDSRALGVALARLIHGNDTLILASSDLSHYHPYDDAVRIDNKTLSALTSWDYFSMARNFRQRIWEACGGAPIVAAMIAAERQGANRIEVLGSANSGDTSGDRSRVVGYGAAVFVKGKPDSAAQSPFDVSEPARAGLLALARKSVEYFVEQKALYEPGPIAGAELNTELNQDRGAFVTLTEEGALRGCIGYTSSAKPLYMTVRDTATLASIRDPRFAPVSQEELPKLKYEISVLSPLRRVADIEQINIGQHGLLVKNGPNEGLLLPQVPVERNWDRRTFLEQTCRKAELMPDCWKDENTDLFVFTAVVFGEQKK